MLVKSFVSNIIIDLSYNLSNYIQYKHVWKLFEVGCLHQHPVMESLSAFYHLDRNGKLLTFLRILIITMYFKHQNWKSKNVYCLIICKIIIFCSTFPDIPDKAGREMGRRRITQASKALCVSGKRKNMMNLLF